MSDEAEQVRIEVCDGVHLTEGGGIMTNVVRSACAFARFEWKLVRITAYVFDFNQASARVLEKNGFVYEGLLRKHERKDGALLDSKLYALVKEFFQTLVDKHGGTEAAFAMMTGETPSHQFFSPEEVANTILFLASDESLHLNRHRNRVGPWAYGVERE